MRFKVALSLQIERWTMRIYKNSPNKIVLTITITLLLSFALKAEINMKDASYRQSFFDIQEVRRTYNSRSLYTGFFGFGWCSNLEKSLDIKSPKEISFKECDQEFPFVLTDENNLLKTRTYENTITKEKLIFKSGSYTQYLNTGEIRVFNRLGQMISAIQPHGQRIGYLYNHQNLISLKTNSNLLLTFSFNDTRQITRIQSNSGLSSLYLYEKQNLVQTVNSTKQSHLYDYDDLNNMVRLTFPDKTEENIVYNKDHDRAVKIQLRNECIEYYDYYQKNNDPLYQISTLTRKCDNKTIHTFIYEFWYKVRPDGLKYLERYKINQSIQSKKNQTVDITYNPYDGNPVRILKDGKDLIIKI